MGVEPWFGDWLRVRAGTRRETTRSAPTWPEIADEYGPDAAGLLYVLITLAHGRRAFDADARDVLALLRHEARALQPDRRAVLRARPGRRERVRRRDEVDDLARTRTGRVRRVGRWIGRPWAVRGGGLPFSWLAAARSVSRGAKAVDTFLVWQANSGRGWNGRKERVPEARIGPPVKGPIRKSRVQDRATTRFAGRFE